MKVDGKELDAILHALGVEHPDDSLTGAQNASSEGVLEGLLSLAAGEPQRLGDLLRAAERISEDQLEAALAHQRRHGGLLGDILVGLGLLTQREQQVVLEFQRRQAHPVLSRGKLLLGKILVASGQITAGQLGDALKRIGLHGDLHGGRLGDALVEAGHITVQRMRQGLSLQKKLVVMALVAALALVAPLAPLVPSADAGQASAPIQVTALVVAGARVQSDYQAAQITISARDIARGHIEVPAAARFSVVTNSRAGYVAEFHSVGEIFQSVQIAGFAHPAHLGADGGTVVVQRGPAATSKPYDLSFRFVLNAGVEPGNHPWPLVMSVRALDSP